MKLQNFPCPNCNKKGLHFADHPHAFGYKDFDKVVCRFCHTRFYADKIEEEYKKWDEEKNKGFYY
jgi:hypothetical protein